MIAFSEQLKQRAVAANAGAPDDRYGYKSVLAEMTVERDEREGASGDVFVVKAIANTASVDLDEEVVLPEGADTSYFFSARTIYLHHNTTEPVGSLESANRVKTAAGLAWRIRFSVTGKTALGRDTRALIREGIIRGVSIGFIAKRYGRPTPDEVRSYGPHRNIVRDWLWLETSVTPMPCNPDALIQARSKGLISVQTAAVLELPPRKKVLVLA